MAVYCLHSCVLCMDNTAWVPSKPICTRSEALSKHSGIQYDGALVRWEWYFRVYVLLSSPFLCFVLCRKRLRLCTLRLVTTRRLPASTTRRQRTRTTRPTTGLRTMTGAVPATSGTTSTPATGKLLRGAWGVVPWRQICTKAVVVASRISGRCLVGMGPRSTRLAKSACCFSSTLYSM